MGKRNPNSFIKRQKEIKRQQKAQEKMARRHGLKKGPEDELNEEVGPAGEEETTETEETSAERQD